MMYDHQGKHAVPAPPRDVNRLRKSSIAVRNG
jgi:hypothetical protein